MLCHYIVPTDSLQAYLYFRAWCLLMFDMTCQVGLGDRVVNHRSVGQHFAHSEPPWRLSQGMGFVRVSECDERA